MFIQDITPGKEPPKIMNAIIEIPKNGAVKYEIHKDTGMLKVDRILHTPMAYPAHYGYFPGTLGSDGDPLDCMVVCSAPLMPGVLVEVRPIGVLSVEDQSGGDEKVICLPLDTVDPYYKDTTSMDEIPEILRAKIEYFFRHYKELQAGSWAKVIGWGDKNAAETCIMESIDRYWKHKREMQ